jgi:two-component system sensor histidine kinase KdpD
MPLLAQVQAQEKRRARPAAHLFGASAGVGKTYAMLAAARKLQAEGQAVLVGVVETHGRRHRGPAGRLPCCRAGIEYRGKTLAEFDLDAALAPRAAPDPDGRTGALQRARLAPSKRWQDVEVLAAGIDVLTTVNVQHLESLNDVVGGITGIRVAETVPDTVFDRADEVVLVDLPADELLAACSRARCIRRSRPSGRRSTFSARAT